MHMYMFASGLDVLDAWIRASPLDADVDASWKDTDVTSFAKYYGV